jgi:putative ABC transport system permease protein
MNIFGLSIRSVLRKRAKTILLMLIIFITSTFIFAGWACKSASIQTQNESKQAIGASFRLEENEANRHVRMEELSKQIGEGISGGAGGYHQEQTALGDWHTWADNSFETLLMEDILKIAEVDGIKTYNVTTANTVVNPVNFERIEDKDVDQSSDQQGVSLRGNLCMELDFDVQKGNIEVKEGRMITPEDTDVCVISREIADLNGLQVGDILEFNNWKERETSTVYKAEVVGIYDSISGITPIMYGDSYRSENIIFTDLSFPEKPEGNEGSPLYQYATFVVENVDEYETVKKRIQSVDIGWERYDFLDNTGISDTMTENYGELEKMSSLILILVCISGIIIICLVFLFWLKGRVHEIGIYLSLGRTKYGIVMQMLLEGILVGCVAFLLATAASPVVSKGIVGYLVDYQTQLQTESEQLDAGMVSNSMIEDNSAMEIVGVTVEISGGVICLSGISVLGIIMVAITLSCISIMVQKPKEILSRMS